jgi:PIN domain nuclease of toxin-antitoxin system
LPPELIARIRDAKPVLLAAISARETSIAAEPERIPAAKHSARSIRSGRSPRNTA